MRSKTLLFLLAGLALCGACRRQRPALVPEISPPLEQQEVLSWRGRPAGDLLFPGAGKIGWVEASGRIIACDVEKGTSAAVFTAPFPVTQPPFFQENLLVLRARDPERLLVFDLAAGAVKFAAQRLEAGRILGAGPAGLVYLDGDRPAVRLWDRPGEVWRAPEADPRYFNCFFLAGRILILGSERLLVFREASRRFESLPLRRPAASPGLCDGESVYYGSRDRHLVKFSLAAGREAWKVQLGQVLERPPVAFSGTILASPADNTVMQFNARGTLLWWQALGSTMSYPLLPMSENLAAVLLNREIRFIDPRQRRVTVFPGMTPPAGQPLAFQGGLYFISADGESCRLQRVANRYGVDIELETAAVRWVGRSVRFSVQPRNLVEPSWTCEVSDPSGRPVFSRSMTGSGREQLAWVPLEAGVHVVRVRAQALGRQAESEVSVRILDPRQLAPSFYLHF